MMYERYEPGNGYSYEVICGWVNQNDGPKFVLTWFDNGGGGVSIRCNGTEAPHWTYIADKLGTSETHAAALEPFITEKMQQLKANA